MFDFSWAEIAVVAIVGLLVIGPEELPVVVQNVKKVISKIKAIGQEFTSSIIDIDEVDDIKSEAKKLNEEIHTIIDLEGNEQQTYDISDVMEGAKESKDRKTKAS